jgi:hypothetical protein
MVIWFIPGLHGQVFESARISRRFCCYYGSEEKENKILSRRCQNGEARHVRLHDGLLLSLVSIRLGSKLLISLALSN